MTQDHMVYSTECTVSWQGKEGLEIMGVTPEVRGPIALTVTNSDSTEPNECGK